MRPKNSNKPVLRCSILAFFVVLLLLVPLDFGGQTTADNIDRTTKRIRRAGYSDCTAKLAANKSYSW